MKKRKLTFIPFLLAFWFFISGCEQEEQTIVASSRPVKTIVIGGESSSDTRSFPAVVDAIQKAEISFRVDGKVKKFWSKKAMKSNRARFSLNSIQPISKSHWMIERQVTIRPKLIMTAQSHWLKKALSHRSIMTISAPSTIPQKRI